MSDEDRLREARVVAMRMDALLAEPAWRHVQDQLVAEHVAKTDELVSTASQLTDAEVRDRLGELRGLARIATAPARIRLRNEHLATLLERRAQRKRSRNGGPVTRGDDIDEQIAAYQDYLAGPNRKED